MDPLSDVLALLNPRDCLTAGFDAGGAWAVRFANGPGRIKCYAVISGTCLLVVDGAAADVTLTSGDCFVVPGGRPFLLASDPSLEPVLAADVFAGAQSGGRVVHNGGGGVFLAGTRFEVDGRAAQLLLGALPPVVHIEAAEDRAALSWCIDRMMAEMRGGRPGASLAAHHLAQLVLLQALRLHLARQAGDQVGWFYALADPRLSLAIGAVHAEPAHRWTLGELASRAGLSRSVFAQRFREKVGETPVAYLTRWRMLLAAQRLANGRETVAQAGRALGYASESAFNTAFRRVMGCSPRRYARPGPDSVA